MSSPGSVDANRIEGLFARYVEQRVVHGVVLKPEELCSQQPELVESLRDCIREYERLGSLLSPPQSLAAGRRLSHYRIIQKLGEGGMGQVYVARDSNLGRRIALKVLPPEVAADGDRLRRFRREARAAAALNHPNIVTLHSVEEADGIHFLTMELVDGETLGSALPASGFSFAGLLGIGEQLAAALTAAHERGIVHRDLKPANIMVSADGHLKILDFGLAKKQTPERSASNNAAVTETLPTAPGQILGTVPYMSPEQVKGEPVDPRSDLFSLGVVLYEMSTGRRPFGGGSSAEVMSTILRDPPSPVCGWRPDLPATWGRIVERCLEKDPCLRYPTARELWRELRVLKDAADSGTLAALAVTAATSAARRTVGRGDELARLRAGLESSGGRGLLLCIAGEPGIGKTTLVEDFLEQVAIAGPSYVVGRGRCSERLAGTDAYLPFLEVVADLLGQSGDGSVGEIMRRTAPWWYSQVASLSPDEPADARWLDLVRGTTQERMKRELAAFLGELCCRLRPVLFLDDLHWSDSSTIDLISYLAGNFDRLRLLVIATYRPEELELGGHPFLQIQRDLKSRGLCQELVMSFLDGGEIAEYLASCFPHHGFPPELAALIRDKTEGNPLFMVDLVRHLRDREMIVDLDSRWMLSRPVSDIRIKVPASVHNMIQRKIDRLSPDDRRLAAVAAVQGCEFDSATVGRVLTLDPAETEERLQVLDRDHGLVRLLGERELPDRSLTVGYRFVHGLYQNALDEALTPTRRASMNLAVAETLLAAYGEHHDKVASELALLFTAARDFGRAVHFFGLAAQNAFRVSAHQEVIVLARRGLDLLPRLPAGAERIRQELVFHAVLPPALMLTRGWAAPEVGDAYARAGELCRSLGATPQLLPMMWGHWLYYACVGQLPAAHEQARRLLDMAREDGASETLIPAHHALGSTLLWRGELIGSRQHLERAADLYDPRRHRSLGFIYGHHSGVEAGADLTWTLWLLGYPDRSIERGREAIARARAIAYPFSIAHNLGWVSLPLMCRGDVVEARETASEAISISIEHGFVAWLTTQQQVLGWAMAQEGEIDRGIAEMQEGLAGLRATGMDLCSCYFLSKIAEANAASGHEELGLSLIDEALGLADETGERWWSAELYRLRGEMLLAMDGDPAGVESHYQRALELARRQQARSLELRAAMSLGRLWQWRGDRQQARALIGEVYGWFSEGFETSDLRQAAALLEELRA